MAEENQQNTKSDEPEGFPRALILMGAAALLLGVVLLGIVLASTKDNRPKVPIVVPDQAAAAASSARPAVRVDPRTGEIIRRE